MRPCHSVDGWGHDKPQKVAHNRLFFAWPPAVNRFTIFQGILENGQTALLDITFDG